MKVFHNGQLVDSDLLLLHDQATKGDAISGWRGDPDMWVEVHDIDGVTHVCVMGLDAKRTKYVAASEKASTPGWRHLLLERLVRGDWQQRAGDPVAEMHKRQRKARQEREDAHADYLRGEVFPKLHWAIAKDNAGFRTDFYMTPRGRKGA